MTHPLYPEAMEIVEQLRAARLEVARLTAQLQLAEYALRLAQARVERELVKRAGSEKALAPTVEDRERIFIRALDADEEYQARFRERNELALRLEEAKVEATYLREKLSVILAAMRSGEEPGE